MEAKFAGENQYVCGRVMPKVKAVGKRTLEWDLNDWKWDGDLFTASPSDRRSGQFLPVDPEISAKAKISNSLSSASAWDDAKPDKGKRVMEKRKRGVIGGGEELNNEAGCPNLNLGSQIYPIVEGEKNSGKKTKIAVCQVEDCRADLSDAKDYHRRHKVCYMHSKASTAVVANVMQRFCQQCSRFHVLQEFDDGKRSCRRRLAGHNRRRRKTHDAVLKAGSLNDERDSNYLLMSLLQILSNMHSNGSDHTRYQDILSHLLRNLASLTGRNTASLFEGTQGLPKLNSNGPESSRPSGSSVEMDNVLLSRDSLPPKLVGAETKVGRRGLHNIDLNNIYDDIQNDVENPSNPHPPVTLGIGSLDHPSWLQCDFLKSSPPQTSRNSDSTSTQSPSSSSGEAQSRTDRIVFKLFGKNPNDFPLVLRSQILNWLSHSPTEIESYIRPGCIILTVYLRLEKSVWDKLSYNLGTSLRKLLAASNDSFWRTGWVYIRVPHSVAFLYNGQVVLDVPLRLKSLQSCCISCIKPLAVSASASAQFIVKGFNLFPSSTRLLCALEGKYLVQESGYDLIDGSDAAVERNELQRLTFSCHIPNVTGRGFIEVEDHGLSSCSFPFIVADKEICSEICKLESVIEAAHDSQIKSKQMEEKARALDFIQDIGWLLHRSRVKVKLGPMAPVQDLFDLHRFMGLVEFSMDHDWCAVMKKLLDIMFEGGIDAAEYTCIEFALLDMGLLHRAVKRKCRPMVELLLKFVPVRTLDEKASDRFLFKPDTVGAAGLTPLHVAASMNESENVLDALTDDPGMVGIEAWLGAQDNAGLTPNAYACLRGYYSYIELVQRKKSKRSESQHVLDIHSDIKQKQSDGHSLSEVVSLRSENIECDACKRKLMRRSLVYRPAMLSVVAIAAVCVCVALLFKSSPTVSFVLQPFRWESLGYGSF